MKISNKNINNRCQQISIEMPCLINDGLNKASNKFNLSKSDIIRSVVYDFLVSSGVLPDNDDLNRKDDKYIHCDGRSSKLLCLE